MNDRLVSMYVKKTQFNMLLFIIKNYLYYMISVSYMTVAVMFVFPFIGDGPIFPQVMNDFFLDSCSTYWWTNILLISNWVPWNSQQMCMTNIALISNEFQMIVVLIPLFGFIYKNYYRRLLATVFFLIGIGGSLVPVLY
jgi:hypothetical protein